MAALEDRLWQISEEFRSVAVVQSELFIERVYDFSGPRSIYMEHLWRYKFAAERTRGRRVLDMACGSGIWKPLSRHPGRRAARDRR